MTWKPHVTVAAIAENAGKFIMVEEIIEQTAVLNQPAGHLEPGESLTQAVSRETLEETGWHFRPRGLSGIYQWTHPANGTSFVRFCFVGDCYEQVANAKLDPDIQQVLWLSAEQILANPQRLRSPMVSRCLQDYKQGQHYPLSMLQDLP